MNKERMTVDYSSRSTVLVCEHAGCGWREVTTSRGAALRAAASHIALVHGDPHTAGQIAQRARDLRGADRSTGPGSWLW